MPLRDFMRAGAVESVRSEVASAIRLYLSNGALGVDRVCGRGGVGASRSRPARGVRRRYLVFVCHCNIAPHLAAADGTGF